MIVTTIDASTAIATTDEIRGVEFITGEVPKTVPLTGSIRPTEDGDEIEHWFFGSIEVIEATGSTRLPKAPGEIAIMQNRLIGYGEASTVDGASLGSTTHFALSANLTDVGVVTRAQRKSMFGFGKTKASKISLIEVEDDVPTEVLVITPHYLPKLESFDPVRDSTPIAELIAGSIAAAKGTALPAWAPYDGSTELVAASFKEEPPVSDIAPGNPSGGE